MADIIELIYADHDWFRRNFFYLDDARSTEDLRAIWEPLALRLDTHAQAEEEIFYPELLKQGSAGDPREETEDAVEDHNAIRDAVREAGRHDVGSKPWFAAVGKARTENGEHLDEEEREAIPDFIKSATPQLRHDLAMAWLRFWYEHRDGRGVDTSDRPVEAYLEENS
jgi:hypothetical protein